MTLGEILITTLTIPLIISFISIALPPRASTILSFLGYLPQFFTALYLLAIGAKFNYLIAHIPKPIGDFYIISDPLSNAFGFTICIVSAMVALYSLPYMRHRIEELGLPFEFEYRKYIILYNLYATSMLWLVYCGNLIMLYICLEVSLITSFLLIYWYGYGNRVWVGLLYFIWTHIAGALALISFMMIVWQFGSAALYDIGKGIWYATWLILLIGMLIKLPAFGPHVWLPWAHAEAPTPVSALLSPLTVGLAGYILIRMYLIDPWFINNVARIPLLIYGILTSIFAGFSVFKQVDYKRLLAYSTVSQMGYMMIGISLGLYGIIGATLQYISHALGKAVLFMTAGALIALYHGLRDIRKMGGLHEYVPTISSAALIGFMTLSGIFTIGMLTEYFLLLGVMDVFKNLTTALPVIIGVVAVFIISGYYCFYAYTKIFYGTPRKELGKVKVHRLLDVPLYILGVLAVLLLFPPLATVLTTSLKSTFIILLGLSR